MITSQRTINSKVSCKGVGLHSGNNVSMNLLPAPVNSGIVFRRTDIGHINGIINANYKNVVATNLGTTIANEFNTKVATVEHLMAAIWGLGIDNLIVELNGPEIPIMDGSSEPFIFLIECAGINIQEKPRKIFEIMRKVSIEDGDKLITVEPSKEFSINISIDFENSLIQKQKYNFDHSASFKSDLCRARTFGFQKEVDMMEKVGTDLFKGGSLKNAIMIGDHGIMNEEGLRYNDEFVRHKALDFIGDVYLAGAHIVGHFTAFKCGHGINNKLLHKIFLDQSAWRLV